MLVISLHFVRRSGQVTLTASDILALRPTGSTTHIV
jgi:hypothetical protein